MDFSANTYLTITVTSGSKVANNPSILAVHPSMVHQGKVGELSDIQVISVPQNIWDESKDIILQSLNALNGVRRVEVQDSPRTRVKRGGDEL
ncbi:hypothetical protein QCA50_019976 [Cerrena zonata]|uniref:Uncharacterized protein n=1 Tax=Cerrena zonata TaxID=2478898 RepID=A0AAW0F8P5_9APHY